MAASQELSIQIKILTLWDLLVLKDQHLFPFTIELTEELGVCVLPFLKNLKVYFKKIQAFTLFLLHASMSPVLKQHLLTGRPPPSITTLHIFD